MIPLFLHPSSLSIQSYSSFTSSKCILKLTHASIFPVKLNHQHSTIIIQSRISSNPEIDAELTTSNTPFDLATPMLQHYIQTKQQYPSDYLLLYQVGDFYECYFEDAYELSQILDIKLTVKACGQKIRQKARMAGIPVHTLEEKLKRIVKDNSRCVVICNQVGVESSESGSGLLIERAVVRVITPGTKLDDSLLDPRVSSYLASICVENEKCAVAYTDVSTGEFRVVSIQLSRYQSDEYEVDDLARELIRISPEECLFNGDDALTKKVIGKLQKFMKEDSKRIRFTPRKSDEFEFTNAENVMQTRFLSEDLSSLEGLTSVQVCACAVVVGFVSETLEKSPSPMSIALRYPVAHVYESFLGLDSTVVRNLELLETLRDGSPVGSLLWAINRTKTNMGTRMLREWLLSPLRDPEEIEQRLDAVDSLVSNSSNTRTKLQNLLKKFADLQRLVARVAGNRVNPKDLLRLAESLHLLPEIYVELRSVQFNTNSTQLKSNSSRIEAIAEQIYNPLLMIHVEKVLDAVVPDPSHCLPGGITFANEFIAQGSRSNTSSGEIIRPGYCGELDLLREAAQRSVENIEIVCREEIERWKLEKYNPKIKDHPKDGYVLCFTKTMFTKIKTQYILKAFISKEATKSEVRCKTARIIEVESDHKNANTEMWQAEGDLFLKLRDNLGRFTKLIQNISNALAELDVYLSFAQIADEFDYVRPSVESGSERVLVIKEGRHPVIEQILEDGPQSFVPNTLSLGAQRVEHQQQKGSDSTYVVITGPNGSGKSVFLRQTGLIQILFQMGSFVPADEARLSICDRIFTRVGAVDDLAAGKSTFTVEMTETASILSRATGGSLILLDEIGRGTAVTDGIAIAWSVCEYLMKLSKPGAPFVLFATHYHELNYLENALIMHAQVTDSGLLTHVIRDGTSNNSYGILAAKKAGLPESVLERAFHIRTALTQPAEVFSQALLRFVYGIELSNVSENSAANSVSYGTASGNGVGDDDVAKKNIGDNGTSETVENSTEEAHEARIKMAEKAGYERGMKEMKEKMLSILREESQFLQ